MMLICDCDFFLKTTSFALVEGLRLESFNGKQLICFYKLSTRHFFMLINHHAIAFFLIKKTHNHQHRKRNIAHALNRD
jgi:hypothetical protein